MRLRSLTLTNFRGVEHRTVEFADGVTVVVGPNEAGKTSIAEALDLLLQFKDSSRHRRVTAVRPAHVDLDPEVELVATLAGLTLTYRKVFSQGTKASRTELVVDGPDGRRNHQGDTAHDVVETLLEQHTDATLFAALRVDQTREVAQTPLGGSSALQRALATSLDDVVGTAGDDGSLLARVTSAAGRWLTDTGKPNKTLKELLATRDAAIAAHGDVEQRHRAAADDVERHDRTTAEIRRIEDDLPELRFAATEAAAAVTELAGLEEALATADAAHAARVEATAGRRASLTAREELVGDVADLTTVVARQDVELATLAEADRAADVARTTARTQLQKAREARAVAVATRDRATARRDARRTADDLAAVEERLIAADRLVARRDTAQRTLAEGPIPDATALSVAQQHTTDVTTRRALRDAGVPRITLQATSRRPVLVDGDEVDVGPDLTVERAVEATREVVVDDVTVTVSPGRSADELSDDVAAAEEALRTHLTAHGATDLTALTGRVDAVAAAAAVLEETEEDAARLDDAGGVDGLRRRQGELRARLATAEQTDLDADPEVLDQTVASTQEVVDGAAGTVAETESALELAGDAATQAGTQLATATGRLTTLRTQLEQRATTLAAARAADGDAALTAAVEAAVREQDAADRARTQAQTELAAASPETRHDRAAATRQRVRTAEEDLATHRTSRDVLRGRLEATAAEGLGEQLAAALATVEHATALADRAQLEADAFAMLLTTLTRHKDAASQRYAAPLRTRVEQLGRRLFGPDFAVTLDDDLQIDTRTLGGITLPFDDLSGGAREQLALLTRVAAAMVVDPEDGVPVILDDTLGFSDPERLDSFNALLGDLGGRAQVVVLTCWPDRFGGVPGATRVLVP